MVGQKTCELPVGVSQGFAESSHFYKEHLKQDTKKYT